MRARGLELNTGAGVNSGIATVGLVGRRRIRIEYTALGDAVNVASRLQSLASAGEVIFSQRTIDLMGDRAGDILAEVGLDLGDGESLSVKGRKQPVAVRRATLTKG
jgi:adenylate cyclase